VMVLDSAFTDEHRLSAHLEGLLGARVHQVTVQRVDLVNDTTWVDVRFEVDRSPRPVTDDDAVAPGPPHDAHPLHRVVPVQQ